MWVLVYGSLRYFRGDGRKFILIMLCAPLFHLAYFVMALPVYALIFLQKAPYWIFVLVCASTFLFNVSQIGLGKYIQENEAAQVRGSGYFVTEQELEQRQSVKFSGTNFYKKYAGISQRIGLYTIYITYLILGIYRKRKMNNIEYCFMSASLLMLALSNLTITIYALHNRSFVIAVLLGFIPIVSMINRGAFTIGDGTLPSLLRKASLLIILISGIPMFLYVVSNNMQYMSWNMILLPLISIIFPEANMSLREVVGDII
jgi:hypothetical protein